MSTRKITCKLLQMMEDGLIDPLAVAKGALNYMSERDVAEMAHNEELILKQNQDDDDDEDSDEVEGWDERDE